MIPLSSCLNIEKLIESRTREDSSFQARATQKCSPRELRTLTGVCSRQLLGVGCSGILRPETSARREQYTGESEITYCLQFASHIIRSPLLYNEYSYFRFIFLLFLV